MGNHDAERQGIRIRDLIDIYDDIQALDKQSGGGKKFWLSHRHLCTQRNFVVS
ncbi:hypothetical protein PTQ24_000148 [Salmonella phage KKP_3822]|uniref:Uncharacterized protein n=1 Tax=Salmonella phage KKP_3822 TaxID=3027681 RepID=A0AAX4NED7_9CAUD